MIRKSLQFSQAKEITADNSNSSKSQQLQQLNLEQLNGVAGGAIVLIRVIDRNGNVKELPN